MAAMATTLGSFGSLPYEIRHQIWKNHLPTQAPALITELACSILAMRPQDIDFWRDCATGPRRPKMKFPHTSTARLLSQQILTQALGQKTTPQYQELAICVESRVLALEHIKKELEKHPHLSIWLQNPPFPYRPKLILDKKKVTLTYVCLEITEGLHLEKIIFSDRSELKVEEDSMWSDLEN
ncbi:hypothetical protein N431DRAFT_512620 [Stipitochalara longipes BDJ]|nr:hypothetical protein N431DRAFT_512620 [Stipitochalara longipes BDJ]